MRLRPSLQAAVRHRPKATAHGVAWGARVPSEWLLNHLFRTLITLLLVPLKI